MAVVAAAGDEGRDEATLEALLTRQAPMAIMAVRTDGTLVYASEGVREIVGLEPDQVIGTNLLEYLHPEDRERAALTMTWRDAEGGTTGGVTNFRTRHATSGYLEVETMGSRVQVDGQEHLAVYVRPALQQQVAEELLAVLLAGSSRREALTAALASISWEELGSQVAIAWPEGEGVLQVSTGLTEGMTGVEREGRANPWAACLASLRSVRRCIDELDEATTALARAAGLNEIWVQPVVWSEVDGPALVTIWSQGGVYLPEIHGHGMRLACNFTELTLRFTARAQQQEEMATHDALTGLVNRRAFLERVAKTTRGGVILYCDLDHFKPVNDDFGHAVGDRLLRGVADRMVDCLRATDLVARLGGDEFAVLCDRASPESAMVIAERILAAVERPFDIDGREVTIGITIGVAHGEGTITDEVIERADRALRSAKASRQTAVLADWAS